MSKRTVAVTLAATLLAACAVGPDYVRPQTQVAGDFHQRERAVYGSGSPVVEFWKSFDDPALTKLVEDALKANTDLRVAVARLDQARAITRQSRLDLFPTVTAEGGYTRTRASEAQAPGVARDQRDVNLDSLAADAFWELDLFGRVRRNVQASHADAAAIAADLEALQVSVAAEVARNYFQLRGAQEQLRVAQRNAENQRATLSLTQKRLDAGRGTDFDTSRSRAELESTLARIPALEASIAISMHRLAVLDGRQPGELNARLANPAALPALPQSVAVGTPADLLRRRPDIQAAERRLAASTARIGVATADLFPRVTFGGSVGVSATSLGDLFTRDSETYAFGPGISWAFLDLGRVRARISAADANAQANLASYEGTVLRALEETENALIAYSRAQVEGDHLRESAQAAASAAKLADVRFENGASDFLQVLDAQRSQLQADDQLAQSRTRVAIALVSVYKSVSGGWPSKVAQPSS